MLFESEEVELLQCNISSLGVHGLRYQLYFRIKVRACAKTRNCDAAVNREFVSARLPVCCVISSQLGQSKDEYCFFRPFQLEIRQIKKVGRNTCHSIFTSGASRVLF